MRRMRQPAFGVLALVILCGMAAGQVSFVEVTNSKLIMNGAVPRTDTDETDFEPVDIDMDGDPDVVCVRKSPFTTDGPRTNILFINDGTGVFTDMTSTFTTFNATPGNSRNVKVGDINNDGWPDLATVSSEGEPTRIFYNNGNDAIGNWQGLSAAVNITLTSGQHNHCDLGLVDFNNDGWLDIYRAEYQSGTEDDLLMQDPLNPGTFTNVTNLLPVINVNGSGNPDPSSRF